MPQSAHELNGTPVIAQKCALTRRKSTLQEIYKIFYPWIIPVAKSIWLACVPYGIALYPI
jgi:hypothetical protein